MAKTKARAKKSTKRKNSKNLFKKQIDRALLRDVLVFLFFTLAFYTVMHVVVNSGGSRDCIAAQEIEAGCQPDAVFNTLFLLPSIILAGLLLAGIKRLSEIKQHARRTREKARKALQ